MLEIFIPNIQNTSGISRIFEAIRKRNYKELYEHNFTKLKQKYKKIFFSFNIFQYISQRFELISEMVKQMQQKKPVNFL